MLPPVPVLPTAPELGDESGEPEALMKDIEDGLVDVVVVYKIDRLSRSLMDFSKLVDVFDKHGLSFVSVTQSFRRSF